MQGYGSANTPELWQQIVDVNADVKENKQILLAKTSTLEYHLYTNTEDIEGINPIRAILKSSNNNDVVYLLAGSLVYDSYNLTIDITGKQIYKVTNVFDDTVIYEDSLGTKSFFSDNYSNLKTALYRIELSDNICKPTCNTNSCGDDGCGGSCGTCASGLNCVSGKCQSSCTPNCTNRICGSNGCGGVCGICGDGSSCSNGVCEAVVVIDDPTPAADFDIDGNGIIDVTDYNLFVQDFLSWKNTSTLVSRSDFDNDNDVDIDDYNIFVVEYLKNR